MPCEQGVENSKAILNFPGLRRFNYSRKSGGRKGTRVKNSNQLFSTHGIVRVSVVTLKYNE